MKLYSLMLLVITVNLDSLGVGISLGARKINMPFVSNLLIALVTGFGTLAPLVAGKWLSGLFSPRVGNCVGAAVIAGMGVWVLFDEYRKREAAYDGLDEKKPSQPVLREGASQRLTDILTTPPLADKDYSGHIDLKEAFLLGVVLSLNNFAGGFGAGILGLSPMLAFITVAICSLALLWVGIRLGENYISRWLGGLAGTIVGMMLIFMGIYYLLTGLVWCG